MILPPDLNAIAVKSWKQSVWIGIRFKGYAFQIEMKFTAYKCGFKIAEVPVIFLSIAKFRVLQKMNGSIFGEAVLGVIQLKTG